MFVWSFHQFLWFFACHLRHFFSPTSWAVRLKPAPFPLLETDIRAATSSQPEIVFLKMHFSTSVQKLSAVRHSPQMTFVVSFAWDPLPSNFLAPSFYSVPESVPEVCFYRGWTIFSGAARNNWRQRMVTAKLLSNTLPLTHLDSWEICLGELPGIWNTKNKNITTGEQRVGSFQYRQTLIKPGGTRELIKSNKCMGRI